MPRDPRRCGDAHRRVRRALAPLPLVQRRRRGARRAVRVRGRIVRGRVGGSPALVARAALRAHARARLLHRAEGGARERARALPLRADDGVRRRRALAAQAAVPPHGVPCGHRARRGRPSARVPLRRVSAGARELSGARLLQGHRAALQDAHGAVVGGAPRDPRMDAARRCAHVATPRRRGFHRQRLWPRAQRGGHGEAGGGRRRLVAWRRLPEDCGHRREAARAAVVCRPVGARSGRGALNNNEQAPD